MFIGRERELQALESLYNSDKFEFAVVYGRRRVGKTALLSKFVDGKKAIYFMGVESNAKQNLENLSSNIMEFSTGRRLASSFASFQKALEEVFVLAQKQRVVLVMDEYPYVARASRSLASTLQLLIDKYKADSKLMLILCGSSMSYMEDHVLAYKAPLYGRRTAQFKILPFDFFDTCKYLGNVGAEDKALIYGMVGGTPQYLLQINPKLSTEQNIKNVFLNPNSALFEEPENLLKQEVREPAIYNALITAIANGATRMSEISTKVGEETGVCATYLKNLIALGLVKKETPYGEKNSRKALYALGDNMFRFWYRFVPDNISYIARGASELAYKRIEPFLTEYMGQVFEEICKQYLWQELLAGRLEVQFTELGRWWGSNAATRSQEEIDIMGTQDKETALFAECKWRNELVGVEVLDRLIERTTLFPFKKVHLYLFAKRGFTAGCKKRAAESANLHLVTFGEILK